MHLDIVTERLILRPNCLRDWDIAVDVLSDPEVMKYVGPVIPKDEIRSYMEMFVRRAAGGALGIWIAELKTTGEKIGDGVLLPLPIEQEDTEWELMREDHMPDRDVEVGYLLKKAAWGSGYATEICAALITFGFRNLDINEIVAVTDPDNDASRRVLSKCGLTELGVRRAYASDTTDYRITRSEWGART